MTPAGSSESYAVCFSGGSGIAYGIRLVEALLELGHTVHLAATGAALRVLVHEGGYDVALDDPAQAQRDLQGLWSRDLPGALHVHPLEAVEAAPSSGSAGIRAVIVCPCSMGTLARVAHGFSSNLVERAADVAIKEGRQLVVVPRETPLSAVHLQNMLRLTELGAVVLPAMPGFYHRPTTVAELVDFVVGKILDRLGVEHESVRRWRTPGEEGPAPSVWDEGEQERG